MLEQETNAYAVLPSTQWHGYRPPLEPPAPWPEAWGATPPLPSLIAQAIEEIRQPGSSRRTVIGILDSDPGDTLAAALASFGRAIEARDS